MSANVNPENPQSLLDVEIASVESSAGKADYSWSVPVAIGGIALFLAAVILFCINKFIFATYHPNVNQILENAFAITIKEHESFFPEPVERMQFQVSLLLSPFVLGASYWLASRLRSFFDARKHIAFYTNLFGVASVVVFFLVVYGHKLRHVPNKKVSAFFDNNLFNQFNALLVFAVYLFVLYLVLALKSKIETPKVQKILDGIGITLAALVVYAFITYGLFHTSVLDRGLEMESNPVFYPISQVFMGKSLMVDLNAQYGLNAWFLKPVFSVIGLSIGKIGAVLAFLSGLSYAFLFLGIRKLIPNKLISLLTFLSIAWWVYWHGRIPMPPTPRLYYQYTPIRILFPMSAFYLVTLINCGSYIRTKYLEWILLFVAASAVLWNADTGLVTFGAVAVMQGYRAFDYKAVGASLKKIVIEWFKLGGALLVMVALFSISVKINSGHFPDFERFSEFQKMFYVSGYFMLPMNPINLWNMVIMMYLIAGIYLFSTIRNKDRKDGPVLAFLFILGMGVFAYFQGRSYDLNLSAVAYPAVLLVGYFCYRVWDEISSENSFVFNEKLLIFALPFVFLIDSTASFGFQFPLILQTGTNNISRENEEVKAVQEERFSFIKAHFKKGDSVLILGHDVDGYLYTVGNLVNPAPLPSSTEWYFKSEIDSLTECIRKKKYPIIFDKKHLFYYDCKDLIYNALNENCHVDVANTDKSLLILKPGINTANQQLPPTSTTLFHYGSNEVQPAPKMIQFPNQFTIEAILYVSPGLLKRDDAVFTNVSQVKSFVGMMMIQSGDKLNEYIYSFGDGKNWSDGLVIELLPEVDNHIKIHYDNGVVTLYQEGKQIITHDTHTRIYPCDHRFILNSGFSGTIKEFRINAE